MKHKITGYFVIGLFHILAKLPLGLLRAIGFVFGHVLFVSAHSRRKVTLVNLRLCFPDQDEATRKKWARQSFVYFCQTWLDRGWLWLGSARLIRKRLHLRGALEQYNQPGAVILFTPHFYGLDAAAMAMGLANDRAVTSIFTKQPNPVLDAWIQTGRSRFGEVHLVNRSAGLRPVIQTLRKGGVLYLLPDMNFGARESIFAPFFGVQTATVPSLAQFARLGNARIMPLLSRVTQRGYEIELLPANSTYMQGSALEDATYMNAQIEQWILTMPAQYYWVHRRFKTRPDGQPSVYD